MDMMLMMDLITVNDLMNIKDMVKIICLMNLMREFYYLLSEYVDFCVCLTGNDYVCVCVSRVISLA